MSHLTYENRIRIQSLLYDCDVVYSQSQIANKVEVSKGTISNELKYFKQNRILYDAQLAHSMAKKRRSDANKAIHGRTIQGTLLEQHIIQSIQQYLSPEQIANVWKKKTKERISHSTIYAYIYQYQRGRIKKYLRRKGKKYHPSTGSKTKIPNRVGIEERPTVVDEQTRRGDYE